MAKLTKDELLRKFREIKLIAFDVDGVLTDDSIFFGPDGFEAKKFNISDGLYMVLAMRNGLELAIISGRYSAATDTRMKDLGVRHVMQGKKDKVEMARPVLKGLGLEFSQMAFVGNEILDIKLARQCGLSIAVADSAKELIDAVDYVTAKDGGKGAVREVLELYFEAVGINPTELVP